MRLTATVTGLGLTMEQGEHYEQRRERAHKRYLGAIKALAEVRKLNLPDVHLNAIDKQINVVGMQANVVQAATST